MKKLFFALAMMLATVTAFLVAPSVKAETTVKIASDSSYAPFEFQNGQKKWVGIDVDIMQEVAKINDWKLEMSYPGFDAALQNLKAGQVDGVIAGMTITDLLVNLDCILWLVLFFIVLHRVNFWDGKFRELHEELTRTIREEDKK